MYTTSHSLHPSFKLNGQEFQTVEELQSFSKSLKEKGDDYEVSIANFILKWLSDEDFITVKTSGSTGKSKKIVLKKKNMAHSALATGTYFKAGENTLHCYAFQQGLLQGK